MSSHSRCRSHHKPSNLPTRLIHVGASALPFIRLHVVTEADKRLDYLTLSHCWGGEKIVILTSDNIEQFKEEIAWANLPQTFRDAFVITQNLGFSYIWIDSLCIVQDSRDDWARESQSMGTIYAGSSCTIAATGSVNSNGGCFQDREIRDFVDCSIPVENGNGAIRLCMCEFSETSFENQVNASPLNARGWVFQERLLSTRILHFATTMLWECSTCALTEQHPYTSITLKSDLAEPKFRELANTDNQETEDQSTAALKRPSSRVKEASTDGYSSNTMDDFRSAFESLKQSSSRSTGHVQSHTFSRRWYELVTRYSQGLLTRSEDKLTAFSGIAAEIENQTGLEYMVGLWRQHLIYNLLWYMEAPARQRPATDRAPSWSWASVDGMVKYEQGNDISTYDCVGSASVTAVDLCKPLQSSSSPSNIEAGSLQLRSILREVERSKDTVQNEVRVGISYILRDSNGELVGRFYPDCLGELGPRKVSCLEILRLTKRFDSSTALKQTRGLVLAFSKRRPGANLYRRIGYFSSGVVKARSGKPTSSQSDEQETVSIV